jgi:hypothetical protein
MASMASDGHTYNPVLTGIHRAAIADSALQFWSGKFPALMRTRVKTPDTYVYSATAAASCMGYSGGEDLPLGCRRFYFIFFRFLKLFF